MHKLTVPLFILAAICLGAGFTVGVVLHYSVRGIEIRRNLAETPASASKQELVETLSEMHAGILKTNQTVSRISFGLGVVAAAAVVGFAVCLGRASESRLKALEASSRLEAEIERRYESKSAQQDESPIRGSLS